MSNEATGDEFPIGGFHEYKCVTHGEDCDLVIAEYIAAERAEAVREVLGRLDKHAYYSPAERGDVVDTTWIEAELAALDQTQEGE
jgi:hypothetical protein